MNSPSFPSNVRALALSFCLLFLLSSCGKKQLNEPDTLRINNEEIPSLGTLVADEKVSLVSLEEPAAAGGGSRGEEAENSTPPIYRFDYADLANGGETVGAYVSALLEDPESFSVVDERGLRASLPDFSTESGTVFLSRSDAKQGSTLSMRLDWTGKALSIRAWQQPTGVLFRAPETPTNPTALSVPPADSEDKKDAKKGEDKIASTEENKDTGKEALAAETQTAATAPDAMNPDNVLSAEKAVSYLEGLPPVLLGLSGNSMQNYLVYYTEGIAKVDNTTCLRLRVYERSETSGTNVFCGTYLLASDASQLFRLDSEAGPPIEIPLL